MLDWTTSASMGLGTSRGVRGYYTDPDGTEFQVVVLRTDESSAAESGFGETLACAGWQVVVVYDDRIFAAGTGTHQRTYTPETPIVMDRTAIPDTAERAEELLSFSPALTADRVEEHAVDCGEQ